MTSSHSQHNEWRQVAKPEDRANERQWLETIEQIGDLSDELRKFSLKARSIDLKTEPVTIDGYPPSSLPESSIASGRVGDPTGETVVRYAGGKVVQSMDGSETTTPDIWRAPHDPRGQHIRLMEYRVNDALNQLKSAVEEMWQALPIDRHAPKREVCDCGISKAVATRFGERPGGWVKSEERCEGCAKRQNRHAS